MLQTIFLPFLGEIYVPVRSRALLLFAGINFLFVFLDVVIAHAVNQFSPRIELIPVFFAVTAGGFSIYLAIKKKPGNLDDILISLLLLSGVGVGVLGFLLHLGSKLPEKMSDGSLMEILIYGAPLVAPLSIAGIALVALLGAIQQRDETGSPLFLPRLGHWLVHNDIFVINGLLVLGLVGNFFLSLEHAQSEFRVWTQWIPIAVAAWTALICGLLGWTPVLSRRWSALLIASLVLCMVTGTLGFLFHLRASLPLDGDHALEKMLYSTPLFAPLLFADLGLLGLIRFLQKGKETL